VLCVRRETREWDPPPGMTLRDWLRGALPFAPTAGDVGYHLTLLFPPVRPRGYLEVRYLDAQRGPDWFVPVAMLSTLMADPATTEAALELAAPVANHWAVAWRRGLADRRLHRAATALAGLAADRLDLPPDLRYHVVDTIHRRLRDHPEEQ
jgi:glutamate--cysteine ligase